MKAFLIDPFTKTITEVEHNGDYKQIYQLIGADCFDCARINEHGDSIFVDDEGLLRDPVSPMFEHIGYPQALAGKGLVLGCNDEGEAIKPTTTLDELRQHVSWVD